LPYGICTICEVAPNQRGANSFVKGFKVSEDSKAVELFNAHQAETKKQLEFLAKTIFLISGGALTLSISLFLGDGAPKVFNSLLLKSSWWALFLSITFIVITLVIMLIRDYIFGEKWRAALDNRDVDSNMDTMHINYDRFIWFFGTSSLLLFLFGIGGLAWVASVLL
jgi:hypothetical protein